ncbi:MAG: phytanoyl-CoA dioxygenase family protein [Proteobacteria bacterium]|nr:phytanoyl-CoA dioxygenase family protein [Pseudomonadota bacterium]MDA1300154.1 phytanoyl-CoA dioxygenase family protein [Pseudomonadota bacterium]
MTANEPPIPWDEYYQNGRGKAQALGNRGPLRFDDNGRLTEDILGAYHLHGFYVFTGVMSAEESRELIQDLEAVIDNAPVARDNPVDSHGRPSTWAEYYSLSDSQSDDERAAVSLVSHPLIMSDAALRAYAHPDLLKIAASINGQDFIPFTEAIQYKAAHSGFTRWHQDGRTHWTAEGDALEQSDGSGKTHGFNLSIACSQCTPVNCLWVVPGSHRQWRLAGGGKFPPISEQIPDAVPALMEPGDCVIVNRSSLHGSYPNKTSRSRMTLLLGYHRRDSAIGTSTTNVHAFIRPEKSKPVTYSEEYILRRARMIPLAIDARRQRYPDEAPYEYSGTYIGDGQWNEQARAEISREGDEYWQRDITL